MINYLFQNNYKNWKLKKYFCKNKERRVLRNYWKLKRFKIIGVNLKWSINKIKFLFILILDRNHKMQIIWLKILSQILPKILNQNKMSMNMMKSMMKKMKISNIKLMSIKLPLNLKKIAQTENQDFNHCLEVLRILQSDYLYNPGAILNLLIAMVLASFHILN